MITATQFATDLTWQGSRQDFQMDGKQSLVGPDFYSNFRENWQILNCLARKTTDDGFAVPKMAVPAGYIGGEFVCGTNPEVQPSQT